MPTVGLMILAAGASSRMGADQAKQMLPYQGRTLLRHAAETALASQCRPVVVVLGAQADRLRQELDGLPLTIALADRWEQGMGASIHTGLAALTAESPTLDGLMIILCDQPLLTADHLDALVNVWLSHPETLVASEYGGTLGVPALFPRRLFPELLALPEAQGAKPVLLRHAAEAVPIPFGVGTQDIDTPDDYREFISQQEKKSGR